MKTVDDLHQLAKDRGHGTPEFAKKILAARVARGQPPQRIDGAGERICVGCGKRHPFNADGTPVGGALPCGH